MENNINPIVGNLVKALVYTENGGQPSISNEKSGATGEMKSLWQYLPDTWKAYSKQITGYDNLPLTPENEAVVTYGKVNNWYNQLVKEGVSEQEIPLKIASMWNAGEHKPDAYKQNWKNTNKKYGIPYDTPGYAKKVANYFQKFQDNASVDTSQIGTENKNPVLQGNQVTTNQSSGLLGEKTSEPPFTLKRKTGLLPKNEAV